MIDIKLSPCTAHPHSSKEHATYEMRNSFATMPAMTYALTITERALHQIMNELTAHQNRIISCYAGLSRLPNRVEFLVHSTRYILSQDDAILRVAASSNISHLAAICLDMLNQQSNSMTLCLAIGTGEALGNIAAMCQMPDGVKPLNTLTIIGAGLPRITLHPRTAAAQRQSVSHITHQDIWSRTIGALGEGTWRRLISLRIGIVGCGRTGSLIATSLARLGVRHLTLIDHDILEPHNVGEMNGVALDDVGSAKVEALVKSLPAHSFVDCLADSALSLPALIALKQCEFIFCCVDNPSARLATAFLAALYLKPFIDIGTGIFVTDQPLSHFSASSSHRPSIASPPRHRSMGADVRLVLPERCLVCFGGIADLEQACMELMELLEPCASIPTSHPDWREQRAGSLRSLNTCAVGFALRLLEDFVGARIRESTWLHLEINDAGIPTIEHRTTPSNSRCPLCALAGQGDDGLCRLQSVLDNFLRAHLLAARDPLRCPSLREYRHDRRLGGNSTHCHQHSGDDLQQGTTLRSKTLSVGKPRAPGGLHRKVM
ncbi:MAG: ThiF family adenylyltransferase [Armatimonadota bacterium]|nr:ThiF family adenylyltransferase [Armatimonadota bacterium]MDW8025548.1 ThiF family adenylyltransferase [Armatimonadota bacterium]